MEFEALVGMEVEVEVMEVEVWSFGLWSALPECQQALSGPQIASHGGNQAQAHQVEGRGGGKCGGRSGGDRGDGVKVEMEVEPRRLLRL